MSGLPFNAGLLPTTPGLPQLGDVAVSSPLEAAMMREAAARVARRNPPQTPPARPLRDANLPPSTIAAAQASGAAAHPSVGSPAPTQSHAPSTSPIDMSNPQALLARSGQLAGEQDALVQSMLASMNQPAPQQPQYQAPPLPQRDRNADIGTALGMLFAPRAAMAFGGQAQGRDEAQQRTYDQQVAEAKQRYDVQRQNADAENQHRNTDLLRFEQLQKSIGDEATRLTTAAEHAQHDRATESAVLQKLGLEAQNQKLNRERYAEQFELARQRLGIQDKAITQRYAAQAATETYRYYALGVRSDNAYKLAQLRSTAQMTLEGVRQGGMDRRSAASADVRRELANDRNWQQNAHAALTTINGYIRSLASADPKARTAAIQALNAQMDDPNSSLGAFMQDLNRRGLLGQNLGEALTTEIRAGMPQQIDPVTGQPIPTASPNVSVTVNNGAGAPAPSPAAPGAPAPGAAPPMPGTPTPQHAAPSADDARAEAMNFKRAHPNASAADIQKHLETWAAGHTGPPR